MCSCLWHLSPELPRGQSQPCLLWLAGLDEKGELWSRQVPCPHILLEQPGVLHTPKQETKSELDTKSSLLSLLESFKLKKQRTWVFATNSTFSISKSLQPDAVNRWYFKHRIFDLIHGLKYLRL